MRREKLEHLIRAAAVIPDDDELIIVGSQAILGTYPSAPDELLVSDEADIEKHDLALAKLVAGRDKDLHFVQHMVAHEMLDRKILESRVGIRQLFES